MNVVLNNTKTALSKSLIKDKRFFIILILTFFCWNSNAQSVIEMTDPSDAKVVLLSVNKKEAADIVVYKTTKRSESRKWDCMWRYKKWGFSDLSIFIFENLKDTVLYKEEDSNFKINGKVYFTQNPNERGYKDPNFRIEGIIRVFTGVPVDSLNDSIKKAKANIILPSYTVNILGNVTYSDKPIKQPEHLKITILDSALTNIIGSYEPESPIFNYKQKVTKGKLNIVVNADGYIQRTEPIVINENDTLFDYTLNAAMNPVVVVNPVINAKEVLLISNTFLFDYDSNILSQDSKMELDKLESVLKENPTIKIELIGYADSKGSLKYNQNLSLNRARVAADYLKSKGVSKDRISTLGKGENNPVSINENRDGSDCPEGRKFNRRVEIKVDNFPSTISTIKWTSIQIPNEYLVK